MYLKTHSCIGEMAFYEEDLIDRQVLFKQMQFSNDRAASGAVEGGVLGSDADPNFSLA
jgi:hypothetical protein